MLITRSFIFPKREKCRFDVIVPPDTIISCNYTRIIAKMSFLAIMMFSQDKPSILVFIYFLSRNI